MKRGWVIVLSIAAVVVVVCGGIVVSVMALVAGVVGAIAEFGKPADEFLAKLGSGDTAGAYQAGASGLRAAQTLEQFSSSVKAMRLDQYRSSSWNKFNVTNNQGTLEGTVTLQDGNAVPVTVLLVNEGGWKVLGVKPAAGGISGGSAERPAVPAEAEIIRLVNRDMGGFRKAVEADDFAPIHATCARQFREQYTPAQMRESFRQFVEQKIDLSAVDQITPSLTDKATLDADGVLEVAGEYPGRPVVVGFTLRYVFQDKDWKLLALNVKTRAKN